MTDSQTAPARTYTLWTLADWRCEVHANGRLRLYHGAAMISEHLPNSLDHVDDYAEIWRVAISELLVHNPPAFRIAP